MWVFSVDIDNSWERTTSPSHLGGSVVGRIGRGISTERLSPVGKMDRCIMGVMIVIWVINRLTAHVGGENYTNS